MKPEITEFTATVDGRECVFKREDKGEIHLERPFVALPPVYEVRFGRQDVWTVAEAGGHEVRLTVSPGADVEAVALAAEEEIRRRNASAFRVLRGHLAGDWSAVSDAEFFNVYVAAGAERLLRGFGRHKRMRVGYSNSIKQRTAYYLVHEATSVFIALPTNKEAEDFWRQELSPLFRDVKELGALRRRPARGQPADTITDVMLANHAMLYLRGAENDNNFRGKAARRRIADEFDANGWMRKKGSQGSKLDLLRSRGDGFFDGCDIVGSTPLDMATSNVWREWLTSDQRLFHGTCPHCQRF